MSNYNTKEIVFTTEVDGTTYRVFPKYLGFNLSPNDAKNRVRQAFLSKGDPFVPVTAGSDRKGEFVSYLVSRGSVWKYEELDVPEDIKIAIEDLEELLSSEDADENKILELDGKIRNYFSRG